jgi:hypothetical protein
MACLGIKPGHESGEILGRTWQLRGTLPPFKRPSIVVSLQVVVPSEIVGEFPTARIGGSPLFKE